MKTPAKLGLLSSLYFSQGLPFGFFTQALPVLLRQRGVDLGTIGLTSLLALPWALKFLWAPFMDRLATRRTPILVLQVAVAATAVVLSALDPSRSLWILVGAVLVCNLLAATQDVATDGLAVALLAREERGWGNGIQVAGYRVGMILGGGALLVAFDALGWRGTFLAMAGLLLVATLPVAFFREPERAIVPRPAAPLAPLLDWFRRPGVGAWLALLFAVKGGDAFASAMVRPFMVDAGLALRDVGLVIGLAGSIAGLVGALVGGAVAGALGRRPALLLFCSLQAAAVGGYALLAAAPSMTGFWVASTAEHLLGGMATAALFTAMMDTCRPGHEASDYTIQASAVVVATGGAAALSGYSAHAIGYGPHVLASTALCLAGVGLVALYRDHGDFALVGPGPAGEVEPVRAP